MNCLIFFSNERDEKDSSSIKLTGARAKRIFEFGQIRKGDRITIGEFGGLLGTGEVLTIQANLCEFQILSLDQRSPELSPLSLWVAIPRPQMIKKIVYSAAQLGIKRLNFFRGDLTVKSYTQSKELRPNQILLRIVEGLEQARATLPPQIEVFSSLSRELPKLSTEELNATVYADCKGAEVIKPFSQSRYLNTILIGPESGWSDRERNLFETLKIEPVSFGERILRVDLACAVASSFCHDLKLI
ncbi:MAG TPA: RsmE family RNA methyltransferase [Oligoflexia bacterium]|nr:RsmE family RNA methyltransferase [Oligoflexia bacterium]HMP27293.1 RsmE family RNA methyltransferase [Oligoflexia bacterium]